ncbi:unnamed protein product [Gadus morhua 'NCC']
MGVKGLSSLLEDNRRISPDIHFRDSKLVVDGNNLIYLLYFSSKLDQNHGGEYLAFQVEVQVQKTHDAALTGEMMGILPPLTKLVFQQTLNDLKVPLVMCFGEADGQLAALAKEWRCPVLSRDTDFYIFDLPGGLLHLDYFQCAT